MCWKSQSLQTVASFFEDCLYSRTCVGAPNTMVQNIVDFAMLTRDYRECSRYLHSSVGNPDLKNVKHVY